jgi:hypothetical protein
MSATPPEPAPYKPHGAICGALPAAGRCTERRPGDDVFSIKIKDLYLTYGAPQQLMKTRLPETTFSQNRDLLRTRPDPESLSICGIP